MEIKTKVCPKCGEEKELTVEFWPKDAHAKTRLNTSRCLKCYREYRREYQRKYHRGHHREYFREYYRKSSNNLTDAYIKNQLQHNFFLDQITPELIELKRQQILAKRLLKQLKQWRETNESDSANVQG